MFTFKIWPLQLITIFCSLFFNDLTYANPILTLGSSACGKYSNSSTTLDVCNESLMIDFHGGHDRSHADVLYIPFKVNTADQDHSMYSSLFDYNEDIQVTIRLTENDSISANQYYFVAIRDSDETYKIANHSIARVVQKDQYLSFTLSNLRMSELNDSNSVLDYTKTSDSTVIYIFKATSSFTASEIDITSSEYSGGYFIKLYFSSVHDTASYPNLTAIERGDHQLEIKYDKGSVTSNIYSADNSNFRYSLIYYFDNASSVPGDNLNYKTIMAVSDAAYQTQENSTYGNAILKSLTNGTTYFIALSMVNKWYFASPSSAFLSGTPQQIEAFLEGKSCYLISAGFQTEHYVLDYFRMIRDKYLITNKLGNLFVNWYYDWAPEWAMTIIKSPTLALIIRLVAYTLYGIFNYFYLFLGLAFGFLVIFRYRPKHRKA